LATYSGQARPFRFPAQIELLGLVQPVLDAGDSEINRFGGFIIGASAVRVLQAQKCGEAFQVGEQENLNKQFACHWLFSFRFGLIEKRRRATEQQGDKQRENCEKGVNHWRFRFRESRAIRFLALRALSSFDLLRSFAPFGFEDVRTNTEVGNELSLGAIESTSYGRCAERSQPSPLCAPNV
jgi:hypothetical protein